MRTSSWRSQPVTWKAVQANAERDVLIRELSRAFGLGGRGRRAGSVSERARAGGDPGAPTRHRPDPCENTLNSASISTAAIRTGTYCSYLPDPRAPARWNR